MFIVSTLVVSYPIGVVVSARNPVVFAYCDAGTVSVMVAVVLCQVPMVGRCCCRLSELDCRNRWYLIKTIFGIAFAVVFVRDGVGCRCRFLLVCGCSKTFRGISEQALRKHIKHHGQRPGRRSFPGAAIRTRRTWGIRWWWSFRTCACGGEGRENWLQAATGVVQTQMSQKKGPF